MPQIDIPDAFIQAAWLVRLDEDIAVTAGGFYQEWGGATPDILARVLEGPDGITSGEKVFALAVLAYLAPPEAPVLLRSFIHSPIRAIRWVSVIALGLLRDPFVLPLLQQILLEDLGNPKAFDDGSYYDYYWHMGLRYEMAFLLGDWGDPVVIPTLCEAIRQCRAYEENPGVYLGHLEENYASCRMLMDTLAFALGCLKARDALTALSLPPAHRVYAQIYFLFGTLHISGSDLYPTFVDPPVRRHRDGTLDIPEIGLSRVLQTLKTHFHFSQEEQIAFLHQVEHAKHQRINECYPDNIPGYKERFESFDDLGSF